MGYYITDRKPDEELNKQNIYTTDFLLATDEEMKVAELALYQERHDALTMVKEAMPEDLAYIVYVKMLVLYIREVQDWMNTSFRAFIFKNNYYRPSDLGDAVRHIFTEGQLLQSIEDYQNGKVPNHKYYIHKISDAEVDEWRQKNKIPADKVSETDLISVGSEAFHLIEYKKIVPVTVNDRKGFVFYCSASDGHQYIVPYHQLFHSEENAQSKIIERNMRRDSAIKAHHLLEPTGDDHLAQLRNTALIWLYYNQDPPELLVRELLNNACPQKEAC